MWKERQTGAFYKNTLNHSALALSIVNNKNCLFITPVQNNSSVGIHTLYTGCSSFSYLSAFKLLCSQLSLTSVRARSPIHQSMQRNSCSPSTILRRTTSPWMQSSVDFRSVRLHPDEQQQQQEEMCRCCMLQKNSYLCIHLSTFLEILKNI